MDARVSMLRSMGVWIVLCATLQLAQAQGTLEENRPVQAGDEISLAFEYVWGGPQAFGGFVPVRVEIENPLDDDSGVVTITSGSYSMQYPVELPARSLRSFSVYIPSSEYYLETSVSLRCDQASLRTQIDPFETASYGIFDIALVGDSPSLITFVRTVRIPVAEGSTSPNEYMPVTEYSFRDFVALPGKGPDRSIGYQGLDLLILGEGAERLTDAEVAAIQRYVLSGGTVLMTGGAVSPILRDERWAAFVPGTSPRVMNVPGSEVLRSITGVPLPQVLSITALEPAPGTTGVREHGVPMLWYRNCGLGMVVYWAFDPFQSPIRTYAGRTKLFTDTVTNLSTEAAEYKTEIGVNKPFTEEDYIYPGAYPPPGSVDEGVFRVAMPPTGKVFLILAAYFVIVVPLNFLVLNKLGKGQLAWVTSPVIGLAFAGVFFYVASDLYGASLSRSTSGLLVAHEGAGLAYATANQQVFFPAGGRYDLQFKGVEAISTSSDFMGYYGGPTQDTGFSNDLVDVGEIVAPRAAVANLAFREIHVEQGVPWQYRLPLTLTLDRSGSQQRARGAFSNDTPYDLNGVVIWIGKRPVVLGSVPSGQTKNIDELLTAIAVPDRGYQNPPVTDSLVSLVAEVPGLAVGTPLGKEEGTGTRLLYTYSSVSGGAR